MKRLLAYLKPHKWTMAAATLLVLFIIVVELYRPIIIGDAIDDYINGYYHPYEVSSQDAPGAVPYKDLWLTKAAAGRSAGQGNSSSWYQLFLYQDTYYMAEGLSREQCRQLEGADNTILETYVKDGAQPLTPDDLKILRNSDFNGILMAAALYLLMLLLGFVLNAADTWMLQKMGQNIIYRMRARRFSATSTAFP